MEVGLRFRLSDRVCVGLLANLLTLGSPSESASVNKLLLSLWLIGAVLYAGNAFTSPRPQCPTQGTAVILRVSPPPPEKTLRAAPDRTARGFDVIELLVPKGKDPVVTGAIQ